jgi:hypothetical protein
MWKSGVAVAVAVALLFLGFSKLNSRRRKK